MPRIVFGDGFLASVKRLDRHERVLLNEQLKLLQEDVFHPKLHTKLLHGVLAGLYSFRVGRDYRVLFRFAGDTVILLRAGNRKGIYK